AALPLRFTVLIPLVVGVWMWRGGLALSLTPEHIAVFLVGSFLAWLLAFCVQVTLGLLALWSEQSLSLWDLFFGLWAVSSGYLIPLELTPPWMQAFASILPFRSMLGFPVEAIL